MTQNIIELIFNLTDLQNGVVLRKEWCLIPSQLAKKVNINFSYHKEDIMKFVLYFDNIYI